MRVLGRFASKDCFVALDWNYRENLSEESDWEDIIEECKTAWSDLFGGLTPHQGSHVNEYLSSNFEDVPASPWRKGSRRND